MGEPPVSLFLATCNALMDGGTSRCREGASPFHVPTSATGRDPLGTRETVRRALTGTLQKSGRISDKNTRRLASSVYHNSEDDAGNSALNKAQFKPQRAPRRVKLFTCIS